MNNPDNIKYKINCKDENIIISGDKFTIDQINTKENETMIVEAFASVTGKVIPVFFEIAKEKKQDNQQISLIDEL